MPKCSVLIIEDEKNIQTFMGKILKRHEYRVLYADNGQQGLEIIRSQCPDIILLDLGLPDMNGSEIIRDVRTWTSTPIIVISARTAEQEKVSALDLGADDYITKPFGTSELLARIRASLRHSNRLRTDNTHYLRPYRHGDMTLDFSKRLLTVNSAVIHLTPHRVQDRGLSGAELRESNHLRVHFVQCVGALCRQRQQDTPCKYG